MRRPLSFLLSGLLAVGLVAVGSFVTTSSASAATAGPTTTCSNGVDDTPGLGLICEVTIVNTFTGSGGTAKVTIRECHGAAGDPTAACTTKTTNLVKPVTQVTQCNNSINGGGGTLRCSVKVTNTFATNPATTAATVNQCVGSGGGVANTCDPFPATTTGATITQCNGSANGGTLVQLQCTATGTKAAAGGVTINQCNGSANGGGALVICSASITNRIRAGSGSTATPGLPATSTVDQPAAPAGGNSALALAGFLVILASSLVLETSRRRASATRR